MARAWLGVHGLGDEWLGSRMCDQLVAGSNPGRRAAECNTGQVVYYTRVPLSPSSIIWYRPTGKYKYKYKNKKTYNAPYVTRVIRRRGDAGGDARRLGR